ILNVVYNPQFTNLLTIRHECFETKILYLVCIITGGFDETVFSKVYSQTQSSSAAAKAVKLESDKNRTNTTTSSDQTPAAHVSSTSAKTPAPVLGGFLWLLAAAGILLRRRE
ncbi:MAG TPA: hypothetical protein O0X23_03255, partial [Methanocorpusculum sp.]|nr:hypothetical protein [Methanocorpusculum sp.]